MDPLIVVNGFAFCQKHGEEYCGSCTCDHRFTNNYQIQDDPQISRIIEDGVYDLENRGPINVYQLGAIPVGGNSEECKCATHKKIDCGTCFNWVEYIKKKAKQAEDQAKSSNKREKYYRNRDD